MNRIHDWQQIMYEQRERKAFKIYMLKMAGMVALGIIILGALVGFISWAWLYLKVARSIVEMGLW